MKKLLGLLTITCVAFISACSNQGDDTAANTQQQAAPAEAQAPVPAPEQQAMPAGHPPMQQMPDGHPPMTGMAMPHEGGDAPAGAQYQGKVLKVTHAAGYTYLEVDMGDHTTWLACSPQNVQSGATVTWGGGAVMHNFTSKSLRRTFDEITFVSAVTVVE